jgi:hypothetical protein
VQRDQSRVVSESEEVADRSAHEELSVAHDKLSVGARRSRRRCPDEILPGR